MPESAGEEITSEQWRALLRAACDAAGGQAKWARRHGLSGAIVSYVLNGRQPMVEAVERGLGYRRVVRYVRIDGEG